MLKNSRLYLFVVLMGSLFFGLPRYTDAASNCCLYFNGEPSSKCAAIVNGQSPYIIECSWIKNNIITTPAVPAKQPAGMSDAEYTSLSEMKFNLDGKKANDGLNRITYPIAASGQSGSMWGGYIDSSGKDCVDSIATLKTSSETGICSNPEGLKFINNKNNLVSNIEKLFLGQMKNICCVPEAEWNSPTKPSCGEILLKTESTDKFKALFTNFSNTFKTDSSGDIITDEIYMCHPGYKMWAPNYKPAPAKSPAKNEKIVLGKELVPQFDDLNQLGTNSISKFIGRIIKTAMGVTGSIALVMFIYAGTLWMTARGNSDKEQTAKDIFVWATLGILIIFASYAIVDVLFGTF